MLIETAQNRKKKLLIYKMFIFCKQNELAMLYSLFNVYLPTRLKLLQGRRPVQL